MTEKERSRGAVRIDADVMDHILDEQARLRKVEGKKPSYSELMRRMWAAYNLTGSPTHKLDAFVQLTPQENRIVNGVLALMRDKDACEVHMPVLEALLEPHLKPKPKKLEPPKEGAA